MCWLKTIRGAERRDKWWNAISEAQDAQGGTSEDQNSGTLYRNICPLRGAGFSRPTLTTEEQHVDGLDVQSPSKDASPGLNDPRLYKQ